MRKGQVALYLIAVVAFICVLAAMNLRVYIIVRDRDRAQNAGDAAAIAAAGRQAELLNEIGCLNLEHLKAAIDLDSEKCEEIVLKQKRLALLGPLSALERADYAARQNGAEPTDNFVQLLSNHALEVRNVYLTGTGSDMEPYPEPWPGAWLEYADALDNLAARGLATYPDNCEYYDAYYGHLLINKNFYFAIAGKAWCWFYFNAPNTLANYTSFNYWDALNMQCNRGLVGNCEIFPLHVCVRKVALGELYTAAELKALYRQYTGKALTSDGVFDTALLLKETEWIFYDNIAWRKWYEIAPQQDGWHFPVVGEVKPEYDYLGAGAVCRTVVGDAVWSAAAKPLGVKPDGLVLPIFNAVRLVPLDALGTSQLETADATWVEHTREHLPKYLKTGPLLNECFYCQQLQTFENFAFLTEGRVWLKFNSEKCVRGGNGPGGHGGTSHGH